MEGDQPARGEPPGPVKIELVPGDAISSRNDGPPRAPPRCLDRRQVEALAGYGVPEAEIAGVVGIDAKTLRKHYRHELDHGHTKANARVAENLYRKATGEGREAVTAAIFWLKTRAGWKETRSPSLPARARR